jgi:hypothetical protein
MHLIAFLGLMAALSTHSASAVHHQKRYDTASFKPTSCLKSTLPTDTSECTISGLPTTGQITLTTPAVPTSWSKPPATASWQVVLQSSIEVRAEAGVDVYDIDIDSSDATFQSLLDANKYIVCYFSAGTSEDWRSDVGCFNHHLGTQDYGCNFGGDFPDEFWLNTSSIKVRRIMQTRIQYAKDRNCSAIDPDNIDGYSNPNGIGATPADAIDYIKFLSREARSRGMGLGLKNSLDIVPDVTSYVDFAVNEQCIQYNECNKYNALFSSSLPVFNIEYPTGSVTTTWPAAQATARCKSSKAYGYPLLQTDLKNYPTVNCGVSRCEDAGPVPAVPAKGGLPIPSGCVNGDNGN